MGDCDLRYIGWERENYFIHDNYRNGAAAGYMFLDKIKGNWKICAKEIVN